MANINFSSPTIRAGGDAKTVKGNGDEYITAIMYLAPWKQAVAGFNSCPEAERAGCVEACLFKAGRGQMSNVEAARVRKTEWFVQDREGFMLQLIKDIQRFVRYCEKRGAKPCVRLNGTSDIRWELVKAGSFANVFEAFPNVQFYDYTKIANRRVAHIENYDLTWSYSAASQAYAAQAEKAKAHGMNIAVVFREKGGIPAHFLGLPTHDGDADDLRFLDPRGVVVALYAKGPAKKDTTGFVIDTAPEMALAAE